MSSNPDNLIAFQGAKGAYSDLSCRTVFPEMESLPCETFEQAFTAVRKGKARLAMIPVDNSLAGRVADNHHLLPEGGLHIIGEHFQPIHHCLLGVNGATIDGLREIHSHVHALPQCRKFIRKHGLKTVVHADTAGAAAMVAEQQDPGIGAIASSLAGEIYDLDILAQDIEDLSYNTTRFLIMAREPEIPPLGTPDLITTFVFRVRNIPAALYKAMGGFATNGVNMSKLESYLVGGKFQAAQFYCDVDGHPEERNLRLALEELDFFAREVRILGVYPANPFRKAESQADENAA